jgi:hypothetical protein
MSQFQEIPATPSTPKQIKSHQPPKYSPGELGKLAHHYALALRRLSWTFFFRQHFHHQYSSISPNLATLPHPAALSLHRLACHDPRLQVSSKLDFHSHCQLQGYVKADPPPTQVDLIPLQILLHLIEHCYHTQDPIASARGHILTLGFFFLLHPGE